MPAAAVPNELMHACLGLEMLGLCAYDPAKPFSIYFSLGEVIGALAFTLAVQQLLKPIYRFRLVARYLSLSRLYIAVFTAVFAVVFAAVAPNLPVLHGGPWGYSIVWELIAAILFVLAYGAVVLAIVHPVRVRPTRLVDFTRDAAALLSSANEQDHIDFAQDLRESLPRLIQAARFTDHLRNTSAFFDFIYRKDIERAAYANSFLRIIADPAFCETLIKRSPWQVVWMLKEITDKHLYARGAEQFVRELAHQAILRDDGMMAREVGYHGFGTAPLLSDSLFSEIFIVETYNPLDTFYTISGDAVTPQMLDRFNNAAERCYRTLIDSGVFHHVQIAFSICSHYRSIFMRAWNIQETEEYDYHLPLEMHYSVRMATKMAKRLLASIPADQYDALFVGDPSQHRHDVLETLVEIVYEALTSIANRFKGADDAFWMTAIGVMHDVFHSIGQEPDGMTPFQQRLTLKIVEKLDDNMRGYYPAICRVLLSCVGPYHHPAGQPNPTAFNILKDAVYGELQRLPQLAASKPDKIPDYLPDNVTYDAPSAQLTHTYRGGAQSVTNLSTLNLPAISVIAVPLRRRLTEQERTAALRAI